MTGRAAARWSNWARTESVAPVRVRAPRSVEDVSTAVRVAGTDGLTVRMVGSGHSCNGAAAADGVQLRPEGLTRFRSADPATGVVTVEAGITLAHLCEELAARGLALTNLGHTGAPTLAGALQTGAHGSGRSSGSLAAQVLGLELVLADGTVTEVSAGHDPDLFDAARVGLGAYGIVTAVTLQTEPAFRLRSHGQPLPLDDVLGHVEQWSEQHDHVAFCWFPHTRRCLLERRDRVEGPPAPLPRPRGWIEDELISNTLLDAANRLGRSAPRLVPGINALASRALSEREYVDESWKVLTTPARRVRFVEQEYAIPRALLVPAVRALVTLVERSRWTASLPVEVRTVPADDAWLSPAHGRDTAYVAVRCYQRTPYADYFRGAETLLREHDGRPHWATLHTRTAEDLAPAYPRWSDAAAVRDRVDPQRRFANRYVSEVLGP